MFEGKNYMYMKENITTMKPAWSRKSLFSCRL